MDHLQLVRSVGGTGKVDLALTIETHRDSLVSAFMRRGFADYSKDLAQQVIVKVRKRPRWVKADCVAAYVACVARSASIDEWSRRAREPTVSIDGPGVAEQVAAAPDDVDPETRLVTRLTVKKLLSQFNASERALMALHFELGYTYGEIARLRGTTEGQTRMAVFRLVRRLRHFVGERQ